MDIRAVKGVNVSTGACTGLLKLVEEGGGGLSFQMENFKATSNMLSSLGSLALGDKCSDRSMEVHIPADRLTYQRRTDMRGHIRRSK